MTPQDKKKIEEEIKYRKAELGLDGMIPLKKQNEKRVLEDLKYNARKIQDTILESKEKLEAENKPKKAEEKRKRIAAAPGIYFRTRERKLREAYEKRKIVL